METLLPKVLVPPRCSHIDSVVCWGRGSNLPTRNKREDKAKLDKWPDKGMTEWLGSSSVEEALLVFVESKLNKSQLCSLAAKWPAKSAWTEILPGEWHVRLGWRGCARRKPKPVFPLISRSNRGIVHVYLNVRLKLRWNLWCSFTSLEFQEGN